MSRLIHVTGTSKYDNTFNQTNEFCLPWERLAQELLTHERLTRKGNKALIYARFEHGPCSCSDGKCPKFNHRIDRNAQDVTALALDIDSGARVALAMLKKLNIRHVWYTTYGSTKSAPRIRVVLDLSRDVAAVDWRGFWRRAVQWLGVGNLIDTTCQNESRLFYLPCCPPDASPEAASVEGSALDVDMILARPDPLSRPTRAPGPRSLPNWTAPVGLLSEEDQLDLWTDLYKIKRGDKQRATIRAIKLIFHDYGRSVSDGMIYLRAWNCGCGDPYKDDETLYRQIDRIIEREASEFDHVRGWACNMRTKFPKLYRGVS